MNAAGMLALGCAYALGVIVGEKSAFSVGVSIGCGAASSLLLLCSAHARFKRFAGSLALIALALFGSCLTGLRLASIRSSALLGGARAHSIATLTGLVLDRPVVAHQSLHFTFGASGAVIDGVTVHLRERVAVSIRPPPSREVALGDRLRAEARLFAFRTRSAKDRDFALKAQRAGVSAEAFVRPDSLVVLGHDGNPFTSIASAGSGAVAREADVLPARERGVFESVLLGDHARLDATVKKEFQATGLSHLLAVDGLKFSIALGAIAFALRGLRVRFGVRIVVLMLATVSFMGLTRFEPSVVRAGAMAMIAILALAAGVRRHAVHALGVAALGLMIWNPFLIFNVGFQLSAVGTLGLLTITPRLRIALGRGRFAAAAAVAIGAQLAVGPLLALEFHQASFAAVPANILAVPPSIPVVVIGMIGAPLGWISKPLGHACALLTYPFLRFVEWVASTFAHLPGASINIPPGAMTLAAVLLALAAIIFALRMKRFRIGPLLVACSFLVAMTAWAHALAPPAPSGLHIIGLNVGYGDAVLVQEPSGHTMLIDGGPDAGALLQALEAHHVDRIDIAVLTHPHADHITGLIAALNRYRVASEIDAGIPFGDKMSPQYPGYLLLLAQKHVQRIIVRTGSTFRFGDANVEVLGPTELFTGTDSDPNNDSVVMRMTYRGTCALFTGDVQREAQSALLQSPGSLQCSILKAPHHGSGKVLKPFYEATGARIALVCVGPNDYGHPSPKTLRLMHDLRINAFRTDAGPDPTITIGEHGEVYPPGSK